MARSKTLKTDAVVLGDMRLGEADRIVRLYTKERGRVAAVAKGVRRVLSRIGGRLEPFSVVHVLLYEGRSLYTVTGVETIRSMAAMRTALFRIEAGGCLVEAASRLLPEEEPYPAVYNLLVRTIGRLCTTEDHHEATLVATAGLAKLLAALGFVPELGACVVCGRSDELCGFSPALGGAVCGSCAPGLNVPALREDKDGLDTFRLLLQKPLIALNRSDASLQSVRAVRRMAEDLIKEHAF